MAADTDRQFAVEVYPPDWHFPAGESWIAGWFHAGENRFLTDIRAWVDGRVFLGLPGIPKPGLDEKFIGKAGPPYSGFILRVQPHTGARLLRLEERNPAGVWTEFFQTPITVDANATTCPGSQDLGSQISELLPALLRLRTQRPSAPWSLLANEVISSAIAAPLNSLPVPPFHGALEKPSDVGWLGFGRLAVTGWLVHREKKIMRITALVDAVQEASLRHGLPRDDISNVFTDLPDHENSHFAGHVDLPANQSSPALIKVFAELENGEKHLVFAKRFIPHVIAGAAIPFPHLSRLTFARALWALRSAASKHDMPMGKWADIKHSVNAVWGEYRAEAPATPRNRPILTAPTEAIKPSGVQRVLIATHNLNFEGAPWFIFELACHLSKQPGTSISVISPEEGPMRRVFEEQGISVQVLDLSKTLSASSPTQFAENLDEALTPLNLSKTDLVIANTMVTFWAIHAAKAKNIPTLLYVHESSAIRRFFEPILHDSLFPVVEEAFKIAQRVVFTANSTRQVFDYLNVQGNFALLPSWVDVSRIDAFMQKHDKTTLRQKHGLDTNAVIIANIGSICERKGQHIFIRTIELLQEELRITYPGRKIQFAMVGARPGYYLESLKADVRLNKLENTVFLPESSEIFDFYRLADIFVCTSFEESFPRVLLESAMFRLPIITTNVNGIAEMLAPDEAWIIPPGDRYQLGDAIKQALAAHFDKDTRRADKAQASVNRRYNESNSLPLHAALAYEALATRR